MGFFFWLVGFGFSFVCWKGEETAEQGERLRAQVNNELTQHKNQVLYHPSCEETPFGYVQSVEQNSSLTIPVKIKYMD